jgi:hypothetical protein
MSNSEIAAALAAASAALAEVIGDIDKTIEVIADELYVE